MYKNNYLCAKLYRTGDLMLTISIKNKNDIMIVRLKGELTKETINKFNNVTRKVLKNDINYLIFNVNELKLIDYKGINKLLYNYEIINSNKGKTLLYGNNLNISKILKKSHIFKYIYKIKRVI